jgi:hypothetical protein
MYVIRYFVLVSVRYPELTLCCLLSSLSVFNTYSHGPLGLFFISDFFFSCLLSFSLSPFLSSMMSDGRWAGKKAAGVPDLKIRRHSVSYHTMRRHLSLIYPTPSVCVFCLVALPHLLIHSVSWHCVSYLDLILLAISGISPSTPCLVSWLIIRLCLGWRWVEIRLDFLLLSLLLLPQIQVPTNSDSIAFLFLVILSRSYLARALSLSVGRFFARLAFFFFKKRGGRGGGEGG